MVAANGVRTKAVVYIIDNIKQLLILGLPWIKTTCAVYSLGQNVIRVC